jgi:hypothetical protein
MELWTVCFYTALEFLRECKITIWQPRKIHTFPISADNWWITVWELSYGLYNQISVRNLKMQVKPNLETYVGPYRINLGQRATAVKRISFCHGFLKILHDDPFTWSSRQVLFYIRIMTPQVLMLCLKFPGTQTADMYTDNLINCVALKTGVTDEVSDIIPRFGKFEQPPNVTLTVIFNVDFL